MMMELTLNENEITAFVVGGKLYKVLGTDHALERLARRKIDPFHVASACLALGNKLESYNNSGKQIIIRDVSKSLSTVFCVEKYTIVLITVLNKSNPYVKDNTVIEDFTFQTTA